MKTRTFLMPLLLLMLTAILFSSCGRNKERARQQVKTINYEHQLVVNRLDALERSLESYIPSIMDKTYLEVLSQIDSSTVVIKALKPLKEDEDLRDDAMLLFDTYKLLLDNEYSEIIRRQQKPAGSFTAGDEFLVKNLGKHVSINRKRAKEKFEKEAARVLALYNIPFEPVQDEIIDSVSNKKPEQEKQ
jgi:hypothetical protein